jgi:hypothetical protein
MRQSQTLKLLEPNGPHKLTYYLVTKTAYTSLAWTIYSLPLYSRVQVDCPWSLKGKEIPNPALHWDRVFVISDHTPLSHFVDQRGLRFNCALWAYCRPVLQPTPASSLPIFSSSRSRMARPTKRTGVHPTWKRERAWFNIYFLLLLHPGWGKRQRTKQEAGTTTTTGFRAYQTA